MQRFVMRMCSCHASSELIWLILTCTCAGKRKKLRGGIKGKRFIATSQARAAYWILPICPNSQIKSCVKEMRFSLYRPPSLPTYPPHNLSPLTSLCWFPLDRISSGGKWCKSNDGSAKTQLSHQLVGFLTDAKRTKSAGGKIKFSKLQKHRSALQLCIIHLVFVSIQC